MSDQATKKHSTVLPYTLGGKDDPHFPSVDEQLKYWTDRDCELIAGHIFRKPWYDREDWEVPGNGGGNDWMFNDANEYERNV